tara:strand:- start:782 stop:1270 length:489 start_codon:yes stop_codon:yes gene_type:complete
MRLILIAAYVAGVAVVNVAFVHLPHISLGDHGILPIATFLVGVIFVLRDFAQRSAGHWVLAAMVAGIVLSYVMAGPMVALASGVAFAVSELADYVVYTWTKRPLRDRILLSSAVGTPLDTVVFLGLLPFDAALNVVAVLTMIAVKMIGALAVYFALSVRSHS